MAGKHMLDDSQTKAGATRFTRATTVDSIETLGKARDMVRFNTVSSIGHTETYFTPAHSPTQGDIAILGGITHRIADQIAESATQFVGVTRNPAVNIDEQLDMVAFAKFNVAVRT